METEIIVAIIGAVAVIVAAIIGVWGNRKKSSDKSGKKIKVNQKATGNINTQVGIQINKGKKDDEDA